MRVDTPRRILFILCFSCFTSIKNSAKPPMTKITDSDQQNRFPIISFMMKPFQNSETKKIDMEDFQINTLEWVHKRLMLFIQNLDSKILFQYKPDQKSKILDRAPDKRTVLSFQWQDMKSHFLIPMAKKHIRVYTEETLHKLEKIKQAFFAVLKLYTVKLITLERDKTLKITRGYHVEKNKFDREQDLEGERIILHNEMYSLLDDLPTILMYWSPKETDELTRFAEIFGKLPEPKTESDDDFGGDDEDTVTFSRGNVMKKGETDKKKKSGSGSSSDSSSSSSSSSSDCFTDNDSDFFDNLTREYFLSEDEHAGHNGEPAAAQHPPLQHDSWQKPPSEVHSDDDEEGRRLRALDGDNDWDKESALARERQFQAMGPDKIHETNEELILLQKRLLRSLIRYTTAEEKSRKEMEERDPNLLNDIERYKKTHRMKPTPNDSHTPGSPHHSSGEDESGERVDNSIHDSPTHGRSARLPPGSPPHQHFGETESGERVDNPIHDSPTHGRSAQLPPESPPHHFGETGSGGNSHPPSPIHPSGETFGSPPGNSHPPSPIHPSGGNFGSPPAPSRSHSGGLEKSPSGNDRSRESSGE